MNSNNKEPGPHVDAVIYMKNLPPSNGAAIVDAIARKHGTVDKIDVLAGSEHKGSRGLTYVPGKATP